MTVQDRNGFPALEQLALDIAELLHRCDTAAEYRRDQETTTRVHRRRHPGLLRQTSAGQATMTRTADPGAGGGWQAPSSRPPGRLDVVLLPDVIHAEADGLLDQLGARVLYVDGGRRVMSTSVADALHRLSGLAAGSPRVAGRIASEVASWKGTALVTLGYADPPAQTPLRCLYCGTRLVAPQVQDGSRYLLCPNRDCRDAGGRRHRWSEYDVPLLLAGQAGFDGGEAVS